MSLLSKKKVSRTREGYLTRDVRYVKNVKPRPIADDDVKYDDYFISDHHIFDTDTTISDYEIVSLPDKVFGIIEVKCTMLDAYEHKLSCFIPPKFKRFVEKNHPRVVVRETNKGLRMVSLDASDENTLEIKHFHNVVKFRDYIMKEWSDDDLKYPDIEYAYRYSGSYGRYAFVVRFKEPHSYDKAKEAFIKYNFVWNDSDAVHDCDRPICPATEDKTVSLGDDMTTFVTTWSSEWSD